MSSFVEGGFTVKIEKISELIAQEKANNELMNAGSYNKMYYATYGPFNVGEYKCEVRVSPNHKYLDFYVCFIENTEALKKCGYLVLFEDYTSNDSWTIHRSSRGLNSLNNFQLDQDGYIMASGLPTVYVAFVNNSSDMQKHSKDDCLVAKFFVWVLLDDSKVGPAKPAPQPNQKPNQPNNSPTDLIGTLLAGKLADVQFTVKEQTFSAHRAIFAARSSVFESALLALQDETCWHKLHISVQHTDAYTFKYLLYFIYNDSLPPDFENTTQRYRRLFIAAYRFKLEALKLICEEKLTKLVVESIVATLEENECDQELNLLKIVPKDCSIQPKTTTTITSDEE